MPKKTKREKILSDIHRKNIRIPAVSNLPTYTLSLSTQSSTSSVKTLKSKNDYSYVYYDLLKIVLFSLLAISVQFVLVWILRTK